MTFADNPTEAEATSFAEAMICVYEGTYVDKFIRYLDQNHHLFDGIGSRYYAKFRSITQSSGTGKTRLLPEVSFRRCVA